MSSPLSEQRARYRSLESNDKDGYGLLTGIMLNSNPVPPENSIRVAYRTSGPRRPDSTRWHTLATSPAQASPEEGTLSVDANE